MNDWPAGYIQHDDPGDRLIRDVIAPPLKQELTVLEGEGKGHLFAGILVGSEPTFDNCAHFSPLGNIAGATCDTWSNESVQNIKLLGGMAPTCYLEQLIYDCRMMNQALADGRDAALLYRKWLVNSDAGLDPQAYVLTPESVIAIAQAVVSAPTPPESGRAAALAAIRLLRDAQREGRLKIHPREMPWLDRMQKAVESIPASEAEFIGDMMGTVDTTRFVAADYDL